MNNITKEKVNLLNTIQYILFRTLFMTVIPFMTSPSYDQPIPGGSGTEVVTDYSQNESLEAAAADFHQEGRYDLMLDSVCGPLTYYNQNDAR